MSFMLYLYIFGLDDHSFIILQHARDEHRHLPWTLETQNICLLECDKWM